MLNAFTTFLQSIPALFHPKLQRYLWISGAISLAIGLALMAAMGVKVWDSYQDIREIWQASNGMGAKALLLIKELIPTLLLVFVVFAFYKTLILICLGPILTNLSAASEEVLQKQTYTASLSLASQIQRTALISIRYTFWELFFTALCLLFHILPGVGSVISTIAIFIVQAYYSGANYSDFVLERKGMTARESAEWVKQHRGLCLGVGSGFLLLLFVPILGLVLAPATAVYSTTKLYLEENTPQ